MATYSENRKAFYDYEILETFEAGVALTGAEVKSIRGGRANLAGAFVTIHAGELYLTNAFIAPYQSKNQPDYDPTRSRKLLIKKGEIKTLQGKTSQKGLTLIPLKLYNKKAFIKLEFALAQGKKQWDKRQKIAKRETQRKIDRALRSEF